MRSANHHAPHRRSGAHLIRSGRWIGVALLIVAACAGVAARRPDRPRVASASDPPQAPGVMDQARTASVSDSARAASASDPPCAQQPSQIITSTINSRTLPGDHLIYVYLPAGYCPDSATRYASIYLLHGAPGNARDWLDLTDLQATADRLIAAGTLPPAIVVLPDGNYGPLGDTQWINGDPGAGFGQAEDYMIDEVVPWIDG